MLLCWAGPHPSRLCSLCQLPKALSLSSGMAKQSCKLGKMVGLDSSKPIYQDSSGIRRDQPKQLMSAAIIARMQHTNNCHLCFPLPLVPPNSIVFSSFILVSSFRDLSSFLPPPLLIPSFLSQSWAQLLNYGNSAV